MALSDFIAELDALSAAAETGFSAAADAASLEVARIEFLGAKSGRMKAVQNALGAVDKADKPAAGKRFNEVKSAIEAAFESAQQRLAGQTQQSAASDFDLTLPGRKLRLGHLHPIT